MQTHPDGFRFELLIVFHRKAHDYVLQDQQEFHHFSPWINLCPGIAVDGTHFYHCGSQGYGPDL